MTARSTPDPTPWAYHDELVVGTIRTHLPGKWRFCDLETGEAWGLADDGHFTRATDGQFVPAPEFGQA